MWRIFSQLFPCTLSQTNCTNPPLLTMSIHHVCTPENAKYPCKTPHPPRGKKVHKNIHRPPLFAPFSIALRSARHPHPAVKPESGAGRRRRRHLRSPLPHPLLALHPRAPLPSTRTPNPREPSDLEQSSSRRKVCRALCLSFPRGICGYLPTHQTANPL